jgi:hypothetical protein
MKYFYQELSSAETEELLGRKVHVLNGIALSFHVSEILTHLGKLLRKVVFTEVVRTEFGKK